MVGEGSSGGERVESVQVADQTFLVSRMLKAQELS